MFDELWAADLQSKADREKRDQQAQQARNTEQLFVLQEQMAAHEEAKLKEQRRQEEEKRLRVEEARLMEEDKERALEQRRRQQERNRLELDRYNRRAITQRTQQRQAEQSRDVALLEGFLFAPEHDTSGHAATIKVQQREEALQYLAYLRQLKEDESVQERQMDQLQQVQIDKVQRGCCWIFVPSAHISFLARCGSSVLPSRSALFNQFSTLYSSMTVHGRSSGTKRPKREGH